MGFIDRLTTIVVTATLTSAAWIVAGSGLAGRIAPDPAPGAQLPGPPSAEDRSAAASRPTPAARQSGMHPVSGEVLVIPVRGVGADQLVDTFTAAREGGARVHDAIDIMAPRGTPVVAAAAGTVEKLFLSKAGGKTIYVRSLDRARIYYYAHLDDYAPGLAEGQAVKTGQALGTVGSTGNASPDGPHLHFAVLAAQPETQWWEPTTALNPYPLLGGR